MLAVFDQSVARSPGGLRSPLYSGSGSDSDSSALNDGLLLQHFSSLHPNSVTVNLGLAGFMAYSSDKQNPLLPRLFSAVDDIFCLFHGHIENIAPLKQQYGLTKTADEVSIIIEAYRTLRDGGPYPAVHVVRDIKGRMLTGGVPFFWGTDSEHHLVLSDDEEVVRKGCGKSFAPFSKGCFFTSSGGLKSFEYPLKELKPVPWVDGSGQVCGATFIVDEEPKQETGMPRVGRAA